MSALLLSSCEGSGLQSWFAADPNADQWAGKAPTPEPTTTLPENLRFPNAMLVANQPQAGSPQTTETRWQAPAPAIAIQQFYSQQFQQSGWQLVEQQVADNTITLKGRSAELEVSVTINTVPENNLTTFTVAYTAVNSTTATPSPQPTHSSPQTFADLEDAPAPLQPAIRDLAELGVLSTTGDRLQPNTPISRAQFVRWLVTTYNRFYADRPARQIRLGSRNDTPIFQDVLRDHPDFPYIQGLAMAGFLPSPLTGDTSTLFRPNAPLTRETLLQWKVPLDQQGRLSPSTIDRIQQTWGFKDSQRIAPPAINAVAADYLAGDLSNIRRVWGETLLLQPQKPVTHAEAAAALWYIGNGTEGLSAAMVKQAPPSAS
ncbi:S-layer homology domain-containing protein [Thermosynechococcus sp. PP22]|uniref:S-layer homology domain-containing protein n=1 Tax=unclassified Thermosynechococcus TaxID=2622553 RepID=UPI002873EEA7|nr:MULTISPECIES: S-layer homology domain-containing protein [unclassified Thermosynechococcus]WNC22021.1 S-layer homology domain-containing protein [Thermosynechococcus sp. PP22]WNC52482.1 S-layer homology domain-containing protein [Thermosynechococcus sp. TG215]WNC57568.1 S-layer homology domain-containing protein [Thermosynechococcus sp. TG218]